VSTLRQPTLETLGLGSVLDIFNNGRLPLAPAEAVDRVFGPSGSRTSLLISGGNGIVGSGKAMQLGSRLQPYGVPVVTLDLPGAPDGIGREFAGLKAGFGAEAAQAIMANIVRLNYDGKSLPAALDGYKPGFVLEAVPEILPVKRAHYALLREKFPGVEIRSVTSGFPSSELGVGILHPAFPHAINKLWEVVEEQPSAITQMLWALGLLPVPVGDHWSFVLDVLFCGITVSAVRCHEATNMPYWKLDKHVRKYVGPNPLRAHDAIGPGATFLTWSCLNDLQKAYGDLFRPAAELTRRKDSGETWYSSNRPTVDWQPMDEDSLRDWMFGPVFQMASLMLHERRAHLSHMNAIGELCAQFTRGVNAVIRDVGADGVIERVEAFHRLFPEAAGGGSWHPEAFEELDTPEWQQLYVNAEHDGSVGVVTISRESLNRDVIDELNRAVDWLKGEGIDKVILTGDFHLATQLVGADTTEFYPALADEDAGYALALYWSETARRFHDEFQVSVGFIGGKRCLGGMLELLMHCHYLVAADSAEVGMPEVTLPVMPGMEGCHWPFRKAAARDRPRLVNLLLGGKSIPAKQAEGWLVDYAGGLEDALQKARAILDGSAAGIERRAIESGPVEVPGDTGGLSEAADDATAGARHAIMECIRAACGVPLGEALTVQTRHAAGFLVSELCRRGRVGNSRRQIMDL